MRLSGWAPAVKLRRAWLLLSLTPWRDKGAVLRLLGYKLYFGLLRLCRILPGAGVLTRREEVIALFGCRFSVWAVPGDLGFIFECFSDRIYEREAGFKPFEGALCVDIGANIGACALRWWTGNKTGPIYCFEPHPDSYKRLLKNIRLNQASNIHAEQAAVSDRCGAVELAGAVHSTMLSTLPQGVRGIPVSCVSLDAWAARLGIGPIDLCKIDVEGHEVQVLKGARETLPQIRRLIVEFHSPVLREAVLRLLKDRFTIVRAQAGKCGLIYAVDPAVVPAR
jgi:FkbM family methyltransferase